MTNDDLDDFEVSLPIEKDGITIDTVFMHGGEVGVGVVIKELSWDFKIGKENELNVSDIKDATDRVMREVASVLQGLDARLTPKVYHHIDFGG